MESIFVDFNNADVEGRVRLNAQGTLANIKAQNIELSNGLRLILDDEQELKAIGIVQFSENENIWVAKIDWNDLK
ncbi:hypothetical protein ABIC45_005147 [Mucilaginibacter rubeus]|uniref:hypothetical protein n=1 Tax=Mucilaginibacter rubeus TaxID=2027860 RepID=UPI003395F7F3